MKEVKRITTPTGDIVIYEDELGNLTTSKPFQSGFQQFLVTTDPSQYALGTAMDDFDTAVKYQSVKKEIGEVAYIIELHYQDKSIDLPPIAVFVYDENLRRSRII